MADSGVNDVVAQIKKTAGKAYVEPKKLKAQFAAINKAIDEYAKDGAQFKKERDALDKSIVKMQTSLAKIKATRKLAANELSDETFGLDDKKTIAQMQALLDKAFSDDEDDDDDASKALDELEKHMLHIRSYKGPD